MKKIQTFDSFARQNEEVDWKKMRNTAMAAAMSIGSLASHGQDKVADKWFGQEKIVKQANKFALLNGFRDAGEDGEGEMHGMKLLYKRKNKNSIDEVSIDITDWHNADVFAIEIHLGTEGHFQALDVDPNLGNLVGKYFKDYKKKVGWSIEFSKYDVDFKKLKSEITDKIKPLEKELIRIGFKKSSDRW